MYLVPGEAADVPSPTVVPDYNLHMGGVDLFDQMASTYAILRKSYCWPTVFLYNFIETAALNSYHLYKAKTDENVWLRSL